MTDPTKNTDAPPVTLTIEEYGELADIVGSLVMDQFDTQDEYREVINEIFGCYLEKAARNVMSESTIAFLEAQGSTIH